MLLKNKVKKYINCCNDVTFTRRSPTKNKKTKQTPKKQYTRQNKYQNLYQTHQKRPQIFIIRHKHAPNTPKNEIEETGK